MFGVSGPHSLRWDKREASPDAWTYCLEVISVGGIRGSCDGTMVDVGAYRAWLLTRSGYWAGIGA